jgi:opacity protein-like surface antigen
MTKVSRIFAVVIAIAAMWQPVRATAQCGNKNYDEYGVFLGAGYYNGEINPVAPFYKPKPALGVNIRHVIDDRFAVSFQAVWCELEGKDSDFKDEYRKWRNASFKNQVVEMSLQGEINFLTLVPGDPMRCFSPYVAAGPGLVLGSFVDEGLRFCIPFGVGVKYCPNETFTISAEWKYRKLFSDVLDGITDDRYNLSFGETAARQRSFLGNDDCYSFIGVVLSFRPNGKGAHRCSAY